MEPRFFELTSVDDGKRIAINIHTVSVYYESSDGRRTFVRIKDRKYPIEVNELYEEVEKKISACLGINGHG